jgi:hypothetical protein
MRRQAAGYTDLVVRFNGEHAVDITNKTRRPLSLPLPGGKRLFLGPGKTGQVSPKALEHPLLAKLLEAGDIETATGGAKSNERGGSKTGAYPGPRHGGTGVMRQSGDR